MAELVEFELDSFKGTSIVSDGPTYKKGIAAVLGPDRILEEHKQLAREELNAHVWIAENVDSLITVVDEIHCT